MSYGVFMDLDTDAESMTINTFESWSNHETAPLLDPGKDQMEPSEGISDADNSSKNKMKRMLNSSVSFNESMNSYFPESTSLINQGFVSSPRVTKSVADTEQSQNHLHRSNSLTRRQRLGEPHFSRSFSLNFRGQKLGIKGEYSSTTGYASLDVERSQSSICSSFDSSLDNSISLPSFNADNGSHSSESIREV